MGFGIPTLKSLPFVADRMYPSATLLVFVREKKGIMMESAYCPTVPEDNTPWGCPWCGEHYPDTNPESQRGIRAYDTRLEAHVMECEPWLAEQGEFC